MNGVSLSNVRAPQLILLGKSGLKSVSGEVGVDVGSAAAPVTGVDPDYFAKHFLDFWDEWLLSW